MRKGRGQDQQCAGRNGRFDQRQRDLPDDLALLGAGNARGFLQCGVHTLQRRHDLHENKGEIIADLDKDDAPDRVDIDRHRLQAEQRAEEFVDVPRATVEHHVPGHGAEERRKHIRDIEQSAHQAFGRNVAASEQPCIEHTHDRAENGCTNGDLQGIPHGGKVLFLFDLVHKGAQFKPALIEEGIVDDHHDRDDHDDQQEDKADGCHDFVHVQAFAPVDCRQFRTGSVIAFHTVCSPFFAG